MTTHAHTGLPKKLQALAKMRGGELVGKYQRNIINYMYRCILQLLRATVNLLKLSGSHFRDTFIIITKVMARSFQYVTHEKLVGRERIKKYEKAKDLIPFVLHADTIASEKLSALLTGTRLLNDLVHLSPSYQTSSLESYQCNYSICTKISSIFIYWNEVPVNHFTLFYKSLSKRIICLHNFTLDYNRPLASLHFNENSNLDQEVTKKGQQRYDVIFLKYKKGGYVVRKVKQAPTYSDYNIIN